MFLSILLLNKWLVIMINYLCDWWGILKKNLFLLNANKLQMNYFCKALLMRFISSIEFVLSHNFYSLVVLLWTVQVAYLLDQFDPHLLLLALHYFQCLRFLRKPEQKAYIKFNFCILWLFISFADDVYYLIEQRISFLFRRPVNAQPPATPRIPDRPTVPDRPH